VTKCFVRRFNVPTFAFEHRAAMRTLSIASPWRMHLGPETGNRIG
jgi:hypothetical protein